MAGQRLKGVFMKKIVLFFALALAVQLAAAPLGKFDSEAQIWKVANGKFSCTFFEGCMYPAWVADMRKNEFPFFVFDDILNVNGKTFKLIEERWAEFEVKENSSKRFIIAVKGNFCNGLPPVNTAYKDINICYTYTIERNSDEIKIDITAEKKKAEQVKFSFVRPRWRFLPFKNLSSDGKLIDLKERFKKQKRFEVRSASLIHDNFILSFGGKKQIVSWENRENGFITVAEKAGEIISPANERKVTFSTVLKFRGIKK